MPTLESILPTSPNDKPGSGQIRALFRPHPAVDYQRQWLKDLPARVKLLLLFSTTIYPGFALLDWIMYPAHLATLLTLRATFVFAAVVFGIGTLRMPARWQRASVLTFGILGTGLIAAMCGATEGFASIYVVGVMLCLLGLTSLQLFSLRELLFTMGATNAVYFASCLWLQPPADAADIWASGLFLHGAEAFCLACGAVMESQRRRLFDATQTLALQASELQRALAAQGEFLRTVSHEFRTPLSAIIGFGELLFERESLSEAGIRRTSRIRQSASRLLHLINDILDLSKIEAGKLDIAVTTFDVRPLLDSIAEQTSVLIGNRDIAIRVACSLHTELRSDAARVEQIILNLASNAAKFTEQGHIALLANGDAAGFEFVVEDTGMGIPHAAQAQIFQAFRQAHSIKVQGGTGLGLNIAKQLCERLGGSIAFTSEPGEGTRFRVFIPQKPETNSEEE